MGVPGAPARAASTARVTPPASRRWLSLISTISVRSYRWFTPPPSRTACRSKGRRPGAVLRVSRIRQPVPSTASTKRRVAVAMPHMRCRRFNATRSAVRIARARPERYASGVAGATFVPAGRGLFPRELRVEQLEHAPRHRQSRDDALGLRHELAPRARAGRHGRLGGDVDPPDVLGEKRAQTLVEPCALELLHALTTARACAAAASPPPGASLRAARSPAVRRAGRGRASRAC